MVSTYDVSYFPPNTKGPPRVLGDMNKDAKGKKWIPKHCNFCCAARTSAPMPVDRVISTVSSDSEKEPVAPKETVRRPRKRRRAKSSVPQTDDRSSEKSLRALLGRECKCKRKNCLQQFVPAEDFQGLLEYRKNWFDLHKLDQDNYVSVRKNRNIFGLRYFMSSRSGFQFFLPSF